MTLSRGFHICTIKTRIEGQRSCAGAEPGGPADPPARPDGDGRGGFDETPPPPLDRDDDEPPRRIRIKLADGKERTIRHIAATSFRGPDGRPMSAADFIEKLFGDLPELFRDEDELRELWRVPETRKWLLDELGERGYGEAQLAGIRKLIDAERSDPFDVLAYIAFALPPVTRRQGASGRHSGNNHRVLARAHARSAKRSFHN